LFADAGDDGLSNGSISACYAADEAHLSQAFCTIISRALQPDTCDNVDNNCSAGVDENVTAPNKAQNCGTSPSATTRE
jgi:hypothetical protein